MLLVLIYLITLQLFTKQEIMDSARWFLVSKNSETAACVAFTSVKPEDEKDNWGEVVCGWKLYIHSHVHWGRWCSVSLSFHFLT